MNIAMRRGACPALSTPMQTGDGLLVRLNLAEGGTSPDDLRALCALAVRHGNGIAEVTARGSFQIRGLTPASAPLLAADVAALELDLRSGVPVETSPLAGLDPDEIADPLPLVRAIRAATAKTGLASRLAPKVSVVVDGGGNVDLSDILADVRLTAVDNSRWNVAMAGNAVTAKPLWVVDEKNAVSTVLELLEAIAALGGVARARDLAPPPSPRFAWSPSPVDGGRTGVAADRSLGSCPATLGIPPRVRPKAGPRAGSDRGVVALTDSCFAVSIALPFGSIHAGEMTAFLDAIEADEIRLAPQRSLIVVCTTADAAHAARETARTHGLIVDAADPRRMIAACPGAPACATAKITTRDIARQLAATGPLPGSVHVSGCAKGCAHPTPADFVIVGIEAGMALIRNGRASDKPFATVSSADDALALLHGNPA